MPYISTTIRLTICALVIFLTGCMGAKTTPPQPTMTDADIIRQLAGTVWVAEYISGRPVVDMSHTSMVFSTDGGVNGNGGCNVYTGKYVLKDSMITFPPLAATMKMCAPALSDQEMHFFQSLAEPQKVSFENGMLKLKAEGKESSVFGVHNPE